ncbi:MAG TPA: DMT family transporter [Alphaproteobacteria bacterium]|nr:DMT family transporter [Alphaproteobacteria bacterium]
MGSKTTRAIAVMLLAMFLFACMDAVNKNLSQTYAVTQILWVRFVFFLGFALLVARQRMRLSVAIRSRAFWLQSARSVLLIGEIGTFILALHYLPLADVHALAAITPLLVTALSVPILGERVEWRRWAAIAAGFVGVLIIVRPGFIELDWRIFIALAGALFFAVYQIMLRVVARHDPPETTLLYSALIGTIVLSGIGPFTWTPPDAEAWVLLLIGAVLGAGAHYSLIKALELGEASRLQPYGYTLMIWAALIGYVAFGQFPDAFTVAGAVIIAASGIYAFARERSEVKMKA